MNLGKMSAQMLQALQFLLLYSSWFSEKLKLKKYNILVYYTLNYIFSLNRLTLYRRGELCSPVSYKLDVGYGGRTQFAPTT